MTGYYSISLAIKSYFKKHITQKRENRVPRHEYLSFAYFLVDDFFYRWLDLFWQTSFLFPDHCNLTTLSFRRNNCVTAKGMSALSGLVNLSKLDLERCPGIHGGLVHLKGLLLFYTLTFLASCTIVVKHLNSYMVSLVLPREVLVH